MFVSLLSFEVDHSAIKIFAHKRNQEKTLFPILKMENLIAWKFNTVYMTPRSKYLLTSS